MAIKIKYDANTTVFKNKLYPMVKDSLDKSSIRSAYKKLVNDFFSSRTSDLYDALPCSRLICSESEMDKLFVVLKIDKKKVSELIKETYYGNIDHFSPLSAKHEFTVTQMMVIKYFNDKKMIKECELAQIHLAFSGKFYPSLHYRSFNILPAAHVMEYVINNKLSKKYDIITQGSVVGAVKSISKTWLTAYTERFKNLTDEDVVYLIQQLYSRIGSFIINIATEYYDAYNSKDLYIAYSSDSMDEDNYHLADSDSLKIGKLTEMVANAISSNGVDYKLCKMCSTADITPNECKAVMESIIGTKENIPEIKEIVSLMISLYFATGERDVSDIKFLTYTISPKPNAKQKEILRIKEITEDWLCDSGTSYLKRRSRIATRNAYERAVRMYFALMIHNVAR